LKALEILKNPEITWELELQIWNLDDKVLHKHTKKKEDDDFDEKHDFKKRTKKMRPIYK